MPVPNVSHVLPSLLALANVVEQKTVFDNFYIDKAFCQKGTRSTNRTHSFDVMDEHPKFHILDNAETPLPTLPSLCPSTRNLDRLATGIDVLQEYSDSPSVPNRFHESRFFRLAYQFDDCTTRNCDDG